MAENLWNISHRVQTFSRTWHQSSLPPKTLINKIKSQHSIDLSVRVIAPRDWRDSSGIFLWDWHPYSHPHPRTSSIPLLDRRALNLLHLSTRADVLYINLLAPPPPAVTLQSSVNASQIEAESRSPIKTSPNHTAACQTHLFSCFFIQI